MEIVKVIGIAMLGMICAGLLKEIKPSLAVFCSIITGLVILFSLSSELNYLVTSILNIANVAGVDNTLLVTIVKIIGVGYITEFTATLSDDYGMPSISKKVLLGGKILIAVMALPIISNIIESIANLLK